MKQYKYHEDMLTKNFLASYADYIIIDNNLFLINTLTDRQILIKGEITLLKQLVQKLEAGVSDEELMDLLYKLKLTYLLKILLREGLIE